MNEINLKGDEALAMAQAGQLTIVESMGRRFWVEEANDPIERLLRVMEEYTLDPVFEVYGDFLNLCREEDYFHADAGKAFAGYYSLFGNFLTLSFVFRVYTKDEAIVARFREALAKNKARAEYQYNRNTEFKAIKKEGYLEAEQMRGDLEACKAFVEGLDPRVYFIKAVPKTSQAEKDREERRAA